MEVSIRAGPFCFKADMYSSFCLLHLSKKHSEAVAMGAIHEVDSYVLEPDSATLSRSIACEYWHWKQDKWETTCEWERQSYIEDMDIILWYLKGVFNLCK